MAFSVLDANGNRKQSSVSGTTSVTAALNRVLTTDTTIVAGTNQIVSEAIEVGAGVVFEIGDGALFEVLGGFVRDPSLRADFTPPRLTDFSWVNQVTTNARDDGDSFVVIGGPLPSGTNLTALVKTAPATPYSITAHFTPNYIHKAFNGYGLCFRASGSGSLHTFGVTTNSAGTSTATLTLRSIKYNSATSYNADYANAQQLINLPNWLRIRDDGTNRVLQVSADGVDFVTVFSVGRTDFITADQVGVAIFTENSATPNFAPTVRLNSWAQGS